jgi:hypothetical protein
LEEPLPSTTPHLHAQAEAFFARQTDWLHAKQDWAHQELERGLQRRRQTDRGPSRGTSAQPRPKGVTTAQAEAYFAAELAQRQRREEALEKQREDIRRKREAQEAAGATVMSRVVTRFLLRCGRPFAPRSH